jgi:pimeloyl-ACP methyl ester carboxylesterase
VAKVTTASSVEIAYEIIGDPEATPMLLIQGLGAQMIGWRFEFCAALASRGFRVIRFDNRDVGLSQKCPGASYLIADMADDAAGLLDALGVERAHIVGQSLGGMIAQELAIRRPEKLLSLCLIYTAPNTNHFLDERNLAEPAQRPESASREEAIEQYLADESFCASERYEFDAEWIRTLGGQMWDRCYYPEGVGRQLEAAKLSRDRSELLGSLDVPVLITHGDADRLVDVGASLALAQAIPQSRIVIFPGMGHELPRPLWPLLTGVIAANSETADDATNDARTRYAVLHPDLSDSSGTDFTA